MLMKEPTEEMIKEWKEIYNQYKDKIQPNKKAGVDIIKYLKNNYSITELQSDELEKVIANNIRNNKFYSNKLNGVNPIIRVLKVNKIGKGKDLYAKQDKVFNRIPIIVGIELKTSFIFVEGSNYLYDELIAYEGLDKEDTKNCFLVAQYIKCKEKFQFIE